MSDEVKFREPHERLSNVDEAEVIQVIRVRSLVGDGHGEGTPSRQITEYFDLKGERLARVDTYLGDDPRNIHHWTPTPPVKPQVKGPGK